METAAAVETEASSMETLLEGQLTAAVRASQAIWTLDAETGVLTLALDKVKDAWWKAVLNGDPEVDTSRVDSTQVRRRTGGSAEARL